MRGKLIFLVCSWFLLLSSCLGRSVVKKNCLKVTWPNSLKGVYECAPIGNFKVPKNGGSNTGTVVYPRANQKACRNFTDFNVSFNTKPGGMPIFLLADRGDCYFTLKTRNAQNGGAAAILVADDIDEPLITMDIPEKENAGICIPSALISKDLGDKIKKQLSKGQMVNVKLHYE